MDKKLEESYRECLSQIDEAFNFEYFKTFFDPVRFSLIRYLSAAGKKSIGEVEESFPQDRSVISRHLNALYKQGILIRTRESKYTYYEVDCDQILNQFEDTTEKLRVMLKECSL